jgi:hypothetical protein
VGSDGMYANLLKISHHLYLQSPGPGLYNVRGTADILSTCGSRTTDVKFGSAPRENAKKVRGVGGQGMHGAL